MSIKKLAVDFVVVFAVTLVVSAVVTVVWSFVAHGGHAVDWESSFRYAAVLGVLLPVLGARRCG